MCILVSSISWLPPCYIQPRYELANSPQWLEEWNYCVFWQHQSFTVACLTQGFTSFTLLPFAILSCSSTIMILTPTELQNQLRFVAEFGGLREPASASKVHPVGAAACTDAAPADCHQPLIHRCIRHGKDRLVSGFIICHRIWRCTRIVFNITLLKIFQSDLIWPKVTLSTDQE